MRDGPREPGKEASGSWGLQSHGPLLLLSQHWGLLGHCERLSSCSWERWKPGEGNRDPTLLLGGRVCVHTRLSASEESLLRTDSSHRAGAHSAHPDPHPAKAQG